MSKPRLGGSKTTNVFATVLEFHDIAHVTASGTPLSKYLKQLPKIIEADLVQARLILKKQNAELTALA